MTGRLFISNGTREPVSLPEVEGTGRIGIAKGESCAKVWSWAIDRLNFAIFSLFILKPNSITNET